MKKLLLLACVFSLPVVASTPLTRYSTDYHFSQHDFVDTVAIEWTDGLVYVPIAIDGHRYRFLLDTGAGQTTVYSDVPLAKNPVVGHLAAADGVGRRDTVSLVALPPLSIGSLTVSGCRAVVGRRPVAGRGADGILGFDLVNSGLSMKIDVQSRCLLLTDRRDYFDWEPATELKYSLQLHVPQLQLRPFGRWNEPAIFDTGSRYLFAMNQSRLDQALASRDYWSGLTLDGQATGSHAIGHSGTEAAGQVTFFSLDALPFGSSCVLTAIRGLTTQGGTHLGAELLRYGAVTFNPRRRRMRFQPYSGTDSCRIDNRLMDIAFVAAPDGRAAVGLVRPGSTPYTRGFRTGDIITAIDSRPVASFTQFVRWGFEPGRTYEFTIARPGHPQPLRIRWVRISE